ncbi:3-phosphoshikimate 1-carboxyvinyltransferase [Sporolactobacillus laevolacticus]|uniref:3-phosphoshikimate 1-carboxyvinyltransferase n=1 Tax=Sporolactobacillus laevolacticus DSM 442 TaxID=1395513 RepID=V6IY52_9BACL|nr:3-phosphoshikimate 1-carboxyvinyltransferase [Sporolactobacillus laevolacticus]EST11646.1 3-phosphoshikimate 1-carboxyvinyltransferase [Sporolactobacillus laevolacticus DSM 442]
MLLQISSSAYQGNATIPPSKSYTHRAIIAASLSQGTSRIEPVILSQDIKATIQAMEALGAKITIKKEVEYASTVSLEVSGRDQSVKPSIPRIDCNESGSTLRFLIPIVLATCEEGVFTGTKRLGQRSLEPYRILFESKHIEWEQEPKQFPLHVKGRLHPGTFPISGKISSQFITGLLFALPLLNGDSTISIIDQLESSGYVEITREVLKDFGISVSRKENNIHVQAAQPHSTDYTVEGDWSQAAFLLLMGVLGGHVEITGLKRDSCQGDRAIEHILSAMGGKLSWQGNRLVAERSHLQARTVDVSQTPDLAPVIAGAMALANGRSVITGGRRLRDKESDRITSVASSLTALGARVEETEDGMIIDGVASLHGGRVSACNDHRLAMLLSALSVSAKEPVLIDDAESVAKSWPQFYEVVKQLGGVCNE